MSLSSMKEQSKKVRLFVALELNDEFKDELGKAQRALKKSGTIEGTFPATAGFHMTLQFLGSVEVSRIEAIKEALLKVLFAPFAITLDQITRMPIEKPPRFIWATIKSDGIDALRQVVENALAHETPPGARKFNSHITLARIKKVLHRKKLQAALEHIRLEPLKQEISQFVLMESHVTDKGASYVTLARFPAKV